MRIQLVELTAKLLITSRTVQLSLILQTSFESYIRATVVVTKRTYIAYNVSVILRYIINANTFDLNLQRNYKMRVHPYSGQTQRACVVPV